MSNSGVHVRVSRGEATLLVVENTSYHRVQYQTSHPSFAGSVPSRVLVEIWRRSRDFHVPRRASIYTAHGDLPGGNCIGHKAFLVDPTKDDAAS